jgi:predicted RNase H-like HicB family nuclease
MERGRLARALFFPRGYTNLPPRAYTAVLHKEEDELYVAECSEVRTVSQGKTMEEAVANLQEATELYMEEFPHPR